MGVFSAFVSEIKAFRCSSNHCVHVVIDARWSKAFFKGNIQLINNFMMALAEQQIKAAFEQSEKEVTDLHSRISQGMREAKKNGTKIGLSKGTSLTTKKSLHCKAIIQKHSKDFGGSLEDPDVIKLCGCSRNSYYSISENLRHKYDRDSFNAY